MTVCSEITMKWEKTIRMSGLIEAVCEHGVGHPVPESSQALDVEHNHRDGTWSVHGCDGCCRRDDFPQTIAELDALIGA